MFLTYIQSIFTYYRVSKKQVHDRDQKNERTAPFKQVQIRAVGKYGANTFPHLLLAAANLKLFEWAPSPLLLILITIRNFLGHPVEF